MAVLQMQRIYIYGLKKERKHILESLQRQGVIEVNDMLQEDVVFHKEDVSKEKLLFEKNIITVREALQVIESYIQEKKAPLEMLKGREEISSKIYDAFHDKYHSVIYDAKHICSLAKQIGENKAEILRLQAQKEKLFPWVSLDLPMNFQGTKYTATFIGTLPNTWSLQNIYEGLYEGLTEGMPFEIEIISASREQTCIFITCMKKNKQEVFEKLRGMGFSYPDATFDREPMVAKQEIEAKLVELEGNIITLEEEIKSYEKKKADLYFLEDYEIMRIEKYEVINKLLQSKNVFALTGYIPQRDKEATERELNKKFEVAIQFEEVEETEEAPVLLSNNGFARPLEATVEAFSPPGKNETDPTMVMSLFYYALFGLMLSDAAYGLIMVLGCGLILMKFKNTLEDSWKNTLKMFLFCGISTIFWGVMFGSYFGDIVDVVSETFFRQKVAIAPLWFFPVKEPMRMLVFSMLIGVVHLYTGLAMKLYYCIKQKDYKAMLYDVILWFILLTSSILILLSMELFVNTLGLSFVLSASVGNIASVFAIVSAIGIVLTNGRESRNPFKRFLKGLYALYGITGYLSDVLSYSRLLALGLATGVICTVINKMAAMTAKGPLGVVLFVVIFVLGHTLNIGINALGAYVHTNRLQYVEFFGKFYEGGGRKFNPFNMNTKYYKFKEEMKNE